MDFLEEVAVPVKAPISFLGVAEVFEGVRLLTRFEWVLIAAKCGIIDAELSN